MRGEKDMFNNFLDLKALPKYRSIDYGTEKCNCIRVVVILSSYSFATDSGDLQIRNDMLNIKTRLKQMGYEIDARSLYDSKYYSLWDFFYITKKLN